MAALPLVKLSVSVNVLPATAMLVALLLAPPTAEPWPVRNFVVECTTMLAPCSKGRKRMRPKA